MKKDNIIRDMGDHALAGKVVGFIAARNDALFGKLLDKAAGLLDDEAKLHVDMPEANVSKIDPSCTFRTGMAFFPSRPLSSTHFCQ